jgi:hypothetical protein
MDSWDGTRCSVKAGLVAHMVAITSEYGFEVEIQKST